MAKPNENYYAAVISLFATLSMIVQFTSYYFEASIAKSLFDQYGNQAFEWATQSHMYFSPLELSNLGVITFALVICVIFAFRHPKLDGKQGYGNLAIILIYLGIFTVYSYINYPVSIQRPLTWVWVSSFAIVTGASAHLLLLRNRLRKKRRAVDTSQFDEDDRRWLFLREAYSNEFSEYRGLIFALIGIGVALAAFLVFASIFQYMFYSPPEVAFSNEFNSIIVIMVIKTLILLFGLIVGVIRQLAAEMHDIADLIRSTP
jgi:hypothetical protein